MLTLESLSEAVPEIGKNTRYWFLRTEGGTLFSPFIASNSIAIGYPRISLADVLSLKGSDENAVNKAAKIMVAGKYPELKSPGWGASQLLTFVNRMRGGDFVLIPSSGTSEIAIGEVVSAPVFEEVLQSGGRIYDEFRLRRNVRWVARYFRRDINPNIWKILNTHQTIVDATEFAPWIDPLVYDFFKKSGVYYLSIRVKKADNINAQVLFRACLGLFDVADAIAAQNSIDETSENIEVKINLNSPGTVQLIARTTLILGILAIATIAINGGGLKFKTKDGTDLDLNTPGLIKSVNACLNDHQRREMVASLRQKLESLKIENSAQIESMLTTLDEGQK